MRLTKKRGNIYQYNFDTNCDSETRELRSIETHNKIVDKLGQYEDIEEQLKIDFTIGGKAMLNGIYTKSYGFVEGDLICLKKFRIYIPTYSVSLPFEGPVGYGKSWALTKEELK